RSETTSTTPPCWPGSPEPGRSSWPDSTPPPPSGPRRPSIVQTIPGTGRPRGSEAPDGGAHDQPGGHPERPGHPVSTYQAGATEREEIGRVSEASDGIARVEGLPN